MTNRCPECGAGLPAGAGGLCPKCLLKRGLETNTAGFTAEDSPASQWNPPSINDLSQKFPELEITRLIGRGGMGAVYQARQKNLDRIVALKILPPEIGRDVAFADRFTREAQALAKLSHPHIVTIHEFGQRNGLYYFIMEFVDGMSLRALLDSGHVSPKEALAIVPQICEALQFAHEQRIVHRDIKPENILLNKQGQVKIADFGLAKLIGISTTKAHGPAVGPTAGPWAFDELHGAPTQSAKILGTPQYMAPEQLHRPADVDHRADIYSLGVVFYQMLTGELPKSKLEPPSRKVHIDVRLDEIVLRALEKEPERRYQQASVLKTQVETVAQTQVPSSGAPASPDRRDSAPANSIWKTRLTRSSIFWILFLFFTGLLAPIPFLCITGNLLLAVLGVLVFYACWIIIGALDWRSQSGKAIVITSLIMLFLSGFSCLSMVVLTNRTVMLPNPTTVPKALEIRPGNQRPLAQNVREPFSQQPETRAVLPDGTTVELLGLSENPSRGKQWWRPDGTPLSTAPYDHMGATVSATDGTIVREAAIRLSNSPADANKEWEFIPGGSSGGGSPMDSKNQPKNNLSAIAFAMPAAQNQCTIRFGVATGPWKTILSNPAESSSSGSDNNLSYSFSAATQSANGVTVSVAHSHIADAFRIVAITSDGKTVTPSRSSSGGAGTFQLSSPTFQNIHVSDIKVFELQTRPYTWVEFHDVSLDPGKRTSPYVTVSD